MKSLVLGTLSLLLAVGRVSPVEAQPSAQTAPREGAWDVAQVLSISGQARARQTPLSVGEELPVGSMIEVETAAVLQLFLRPGLVAAVLGPAWVEVLADGLEVHTGETVALLARQSDGLEVHTGETVALAGQGGVLVARGWRIALHPHGASVLLDGSQAYVQEGRARLLPPLARRGWRLLSQLPAESIQSEQIVGRGQLGILGSSDRAQIVAGRPPEELVRRVRRYQAPERFTPTLDEVSLAEVQKVKRWGQEQTQAQREAASCGCTESKSSSGGTLNGQNGAQTPLEKINTPVRVLILGLPRKIH
jgi:hypothetical protein